MNKTNYLIMHACTNIHQVAWQVLARLADIHQALLRGLARLADIRKHFGQVRQTCPHLPTSFARTYHTWWHSPNAIFEKDVNCLTKFARVLSESCKFCASGHYLIIMSFSRHLAYDQSLGVPQKLFGGIKCRQKIFGARCAKI